MIQSCDEKLVAPIVPFRPMGENDDVTVFWIAIKQIVQLLSLCHDISLRGMVKSLNLNSALPIVCSSVVVEYNT
ncbi:hypothetical protein DC58_04950 [Vibrio navarrensis]|nr:hypothetical protein EA24_18700 [Vibrio navarrensis]KGK22794.1 hypothetical protein DC58_04950 [Vibrio navarrensis]